VEIEEAAAFEVVGDDGDMGGVRSCQVVETEKREEDVLVAVGGVAFVYHAP